MKHKFQLSDFPDSNFEIETSIWTGKFKLLKDNIEVEQSKEKGKPFLIPNENNELIKAFQKTSFPDFAPILEINGTKNQIFEQLSWPQYVIGGLPILLIFLGGAIGGAVGGLGMVLNLNIFRHEGSETSKYLKTAGITLGAFVLYLILAAFISNLFGN